MILLRETNTRTTHLSSTGIGRHNQNHVTEIRLATVVIRQRTVVHNLKQNIEHLRVSLLDFIQK